MFQFVILLSVVAACALGADVPEGMIPQLDGRVVGGQIARIDNTPYIGSMLVMGHHHCGVTICSTRFLVTAAHCMKFISALFVKVRVGSSYCNSGGVVKQVAGLHPHENFNFRTMSNDIAIITLASKLHYNAYIKPIALATATPANRTTALVSGWGNTSAKSKIEPIRLRTVAVSIIPRDSCTSEPYRYGTKVQKGMLCAGSLGRDACQGDSGGPLYSGKALVGIVSWGTGCAEPEHPGVYTDVAHYIPWLKKHMKRRRRRRH